MRALSAADWESSAGRPVVWEGGRSDRAFLDYRPFPKPKEKPSKNRILGFPLKRPPNPERMVSIQ